MHIVFIPQLDLHIIMFADECERRLSEVYIDVSSLKDLLFSVLGPL